MSDREQFPELIDQYNNGQLSGDQLTTFLELLKTNPRLREEVKLDSELNEILANEDILDLRQKIIVIQKKYQKRKGPDLHFFLLAASVLLLLGIEALLFMTNANRHPSNSITGISNHKQDLKQIPGISRVEHKVIPKESVNKGKNMIDQKKETMLAANFRTNPSFENMIGATRHAGYFRMDYPVIGFRFTVKEVIRFEWSMDGQAGINLKIMDNTGTSVHESVLIRQNNYSLPPGTLKRGLYYFKVMQNDEILFFGKFMVK